MRVKDLATEPLPLVRKILKTGKTGKQEKHENKKSRQQELMISTDQAVTKA